MSQYMLLVYQEEVDLSEQCAIALTANAVEREELERRLGTLR